MGADIFSIDLGLSLRIINTYGPCHQRESFWRQFFNRTLLALDRIILGGDMNFSLGFRESWGSMAQVDSITKFMRSTLEQSDFIDIPMQKPLPTWRNKRVGAAALARRLDRFLLKGPLIHQLHFYKQWVGSGGISDHSPIMMEILGPHQKPKSPFKFNHLWIQDQSFTNMKTREDGQLALVEEELKDLLDERNLGFITGDNKARLVEVENQRNNILRKREESLRLRSRATWLKAGDENTRFFHNFAKGKKVANTIWNLPLPEGGLADSFNKLSQLGTAHFRGLYKSPVGTNLAEIINVATHLPRYVNEEDSADLSAPVTIEELESTLKWFKKEKSPGLDGWNIEFYIAFFDLIGKDLLRVVEESRSTGCLYNAINSTFIALIPKSDSPSSFDDYRPISLCNVLYKIISKIIANRIKPILSKHIAPQQFAFLEDR
eukprot:PITA_24074